MRLPTSRRSVAGPLGRAARAGSLAALGLLVALAAGAVRAQSEVEDASPHSDAVLVADVAAVQPGRPFDVALRLTMDAGWHSYWQNPGDSGMPTAITWELQAGWTASPLRWPAPERIETPPLVSYGYSDEVLLLATLTPPADIQAGEVTLRGQATWLICEELCLPAEADVALALPVGSEAATSGSALADAQRLLPAALPDWRVRAEPAPGGYALVVTPPPGWSGDPSGAYFFADTAGVVQHNAPQTVARERDGGGFRIALVGSEFASRPVTRLTGVLVAPDGQTWGPGGVRALVVAAPVRGADLAGRGDEAGGLSFVAALLLAFGGGLLLNLMPCVFPILSIKVLGFTGGQEGSELRRHGLLFGAGVLVSFWALAAALLALRAAGEGLGWGFQLQSPLVVAGLALLLFALGLNLAGVFEVGTGLAAAGGRLDRRGGPAGAFLSGVLATVVATPCTAPFMGAALGFALAQPAALALVVFTALALGMALPYVLLAFFPAWTRRLPRPGPWMQTLRQALAFPLFGTVVWLLWVFGLQAGVNGLGLLLGSLVLLALAAWAFGRPASSPRAAWVPRGVAVAAAALALLAAAAGARSASAEATSSASAAEADGWAPYSRAAVEAAVAEGRPVFVDFTAAWCASCQTNKLFALDTDRVERAFREKNVALFRADWTNRDPEIAAALAAFDRSGVPLYVLYPGGGAPPALLPAVLTPGVVLDALDAVLTSAPVATR